MKIDQKYSQQFIVVTGPESSGKTTLANLISNAHNRHLIHEYAREYLENKWLKQHNYQYTFEDIEKIALKQCELEKKAAQLHDYIVCDTDIITCQIWAKEKFNKYLEIETPFLEQKMYLLCPPDIPWKPDPLRENRYDRERIFDLYLNYFSENDIKYTILQRETNTLFKIKK